MDYAGRIVGLVLFGFILFMVTRLSFRDSILNVIRSRKSLWSKCTGIIIFSKVDGEMSNKSHNHYSPKISYRYVVDGFTHNSETVFLSGNPTDRLERINELLLKYPDSKQVTVYFLKGNHKISILEPPSLNLSMIVSLILDLLILLACGFGVYLVIKGWGTPIVIQPD